MNFKNIDNISEEIKKQIEAVKNVWEKALGDDLIGIYIHGSLALTCFVEATSDIDILVVVKRHIKRNERLMIAEAIIKLDQKPCPLEMSAIRIDDLSNKVFPVICQFHYSDYWTTSYQQVLNKDVESNYILDHDFEDSDIASYIEVINQCGITLCGQEITSVFPKIDKKIFWDSISADVDDFEFDNYNPRYFASNILILGRILSFKVEKKVLSKYESSLWLLSYLPTEYHYIIENAIRVWFQNEGTMDYKKEDLEHLKAYLISKIKE